MENKDGEGATYNGLGNSYNRLVEVQKAMYYHKLGLDISKGKQDRAGEGPAFDNLGNDHYNLGGSYQVSQDES